MIKSVTMIDFNYSSEVVSSPTVIVSGRCNAAAKGVIQFINNGNKVFPPLVFEINNYQFKALVHVSPGEPNNFEVTAYDAGTIDWKGHAYNLGNLVDYGNLTLHYNELPENKPVHLCVVIGSDSKGKYDMPKYKLRRGEVANLDTAIQRLKVAGRLMQAFTQDEFHRIGLSNRSFPFVEETMDDQKIFGYNVRSQIPHKEIKVHVLRSHLTVKELRNPDYAQQYDKAKNNGFLFSHAIDLICGSDLISPYRERHTNIQCAVMYLDSTWNGKFITTHAALGGGSLEVSMAVFGSHGLHSYPLNFLQVGPAFVDDTKLSIDEVANDSNQCSTSWECLNICMGAFMHEIGHSLGSPHQTDGVMLRDYIWWNRQFMTREAVCIRDNSAGFVVRPNGEFENNCHWNIRDLIRYFYHGSFSIPIDNFGKLGDTTMVDRDIGGSPLMFVLEPGTISVKSSAGIFMVEVIEEELARYHIAYYPQAYGGQGLQNELLLSFDELYQNFKNSYESASEKFDVRIMSLAGDLYLEDFKKSCYPRKSSLVISDFGRGKIVGYKGQLLGAQDRTGSPMAVDLDKVISFEIHAGGALDGFTFIFGNGESLRFGNITGHTSSFDLEEGERLTKFHFRHGQWIDALQVETDRGRKSELCGNIYGGRLTTLEAPSPRHKIVGFYGSCGDWVDSVGIIYSSEA